MKTPDFYRPPVERLTTIEGRVDLRDVAMLLRFFEAEFSMYFSSRSDLIRGIVEFAATVARNKRPDITTPDNNQQAADMLAQHGIGGRKRGTRRQESFERTVLGSESFDATHFNISPESIQRVVEALTVLRDNMGEPRGVIEARAHKAAGEIGCDPQDIIDKLYPPVQQTMPTTPPRRPHDDVIVSRPNMSRDDILNERSKRDSEMDEKMRRALTQLPTDVVKKE